MLALIAIHQESTDFTCNVSNVDGDLPTVGSLSVESIQGLKPSWNALRQNMITAWKKVKRFHALILLLEAHPKEITPNSEKVSYKKLSVAARFILMKNSKQLAQPPSNTWLIQRVQSVHERFSKYFLTVCIMQGTAIRKDVW